MSKNEIGKFFDHAVADFQPREDVTDITDHFFLFIEFSKKLATRYEALVSSEGKHAVNLELGKLIKVKYNLGNIIRNHRPISTLIKSYMRHSQP